MDLAAYLSSSGQTPTAFARKAGVNHSVILRILSGERKPNWTTMRRIAAASDGQVKTLDDFVKEGEAVTEGSDNELYGRYVIEGRSAANHQWVLGDLAIEVSKLKNYGNAILERYAEDIGVEYSTLRDYHSAAKAWDKNVVRPTFSIAKILATHPDRVAIVTADPHMRCEEAQEIMAKFRDQKVIKRLFF
jgi:transcriptional regulator with XRE-family HTH domain